MLRSLAYALLLGSAVLSLSACLPKQTYVIPQPSLGNVTVAPVPADKEASIIPPGPHKCFVVQGRWFNTVWIPTHKVCKYGINHQRNSQTWIAGYWRCIYYNRGGTCNSPSWVPAHWSKTILIH
jgi:hypothetical protein